MDSIHIDTGVKRIMINDDPNNVIEFNPADVAFAERFYGLLKDFEAKQAEYQRRAQEANEKNDLDENGIPVNLVENMTLMREACEFMRGKIDYLFGTGTSQKVFGDTLVLDQFAQFFQGMTPFIKSARQDKVDRYQKQPHGKRVMK